MQTMFSGAHTTFEPATLGGKESGGYFDRPKEIDFSRDQSFKIGNATVQFLMTEHKCVVTVPAGEIVTVLVEEVSGRYEGILIDPKLTQSNSSTLAIDMCQHPRKQVTIKVTNTGKPPENVWYRYIEPALEAPIE